MKKKMKLFGFLCLLMCALALAPTGNAEAASAKKKALKAYEKFLSKSSIKIPDGQTIRRSDCRFAVIYLDNNSVPELVLDASTWSDPWYPSGLVYTYKGGKVKKVGKVHLMTGKLDYYKKKGVLVHYVRHDAGSNTWYGRMSGGKLKSVSASAAKRYSGSKKKTKVKFYANTASMRKKHLK